MADARLRESSLKCLPRLWQLASDAEEGLFVRENPETKSTDSALL
jgi:hypothetical protein